MFQGPDYTQNVSMRLSEVLDDIGVNDRIVLKRRRTWLLGESMDTISVQLQEMNNSIYNLGSQTEGTTTLGLSSDLDKLLCINYINVIQDWIDWKPGVLNLLMIQDEMVSPGYCLLQRLRGDIPLPYNYVPNQDYYGDRAGRILLRNKTISAAVARSHVEGERHGPAHTRHGGPRFYDVDIVGAFPCKSWPLQALQWLDLPGVGQWPSDDMRRYCSTTGCFVVGVGSKGSENEELEWRISTSLAERCLMFNLNITQIRCYVLMKMILKAFFKPLFGDNVSSFMCKTVLFHFIAKTHSNIWRENNLLVCLSLCLFVLYNNIVNENCPHIFIPGNNLMRGHISHESKPYILEILQNIINSEGKALLGIKFDALGERLLLNFSFLFSFKTSDAVSGILLTTTAGYSDMFAWDCQIDCRNCSYEATVRTLLKHILKLVTAFNQCHGLEKRSHCLFASRFCTTLGSVLASLSIQQSNSVSAEALRWISLGLNTDVASSKLKLASMFYCIGDFLRTEIVLRDIEGSYDLDSVEPVCCHHYFTQHLRRGFMAISDNHNEEAIQNIVAFCVRYFRCEINCVPHELRYEFFRSTEENPALRGTDDWTDCAVVDSLPYLYFLQYKTSGYLGRQDDMKRALWNLVRTTDKEPNLRHRETALNLLGQCMEQEDNTRAALNSYLLSLNLRGRNNAAKIHICRLLSTIVNNQPV